MRTKNICENCSSHLRSDETFCGVCGAFIEPGEKNNIPVECETHPDLRADGLCVVCSRPVCSECGRRSAGKMLCSDPEHRFMLQEWSVVCQPESEFHAEAFVRNLADSGIEARSFSLHDHIAAHWLNETRVLVFVKTTEYERAQTLLRDLNLIEND